MPEFSVHTPYMVVENKRQLVRNDVNDKAEIFFLSHSTPVHCVMRAQRPELLYNDIARHAHKLYNLAPMIDMLNGFGERGGFTRLLGLIELYEDRDCELDVTHLI